VEIAKRRGFPVHLSTLANVSLTKILARLRSSSNNNKRHNSPDDSLAKYSFFSSLNIDRVVLPRELSIDEARAMAAACPDGLELEIFVHGALCYAVSGRCYWSSYLGGKSGIRGRCVQPCRRIYTQKDHRQGFFSCNDLSLDVLVRPLQKIKNIRSWKIEGRKKGPHYVFYTVQAYRLLRDEGDSPASRKAALFLLGMALGRPGTHYTFLPQRPFCPIDKQRPGSGLFLGRMRKKAVFVSRQNLLKGDVIRIGFEDEKTHAVHRISRSIPKGGKFYLKSKRKKGLQKVSFPTPAEGTPVFLIDRREKDLQDVLKRYEKELEEIPLSDIRSIRSSRVVVSTHKAVIRKNRNITLSISRNLEKRKTSNSGIWLSLNNWKKIPKSLLSSIWFFLPPVIFPKEEQEWYKAINRVCALGGKNFVVNAPWQIALFPETRGGTMGKNPVKNIWAGPFCNIANSSAVKVLSRVGFSGAFVSSELGQRDLLDLPGKSPLPLGIVIKGNWPLCIARTVSPDIELNIPFSSPKREDAWVVKRDANYWVYPNWPIDLHEKRRELVRAGYAVFANFVETIPKHVSEKKRPGKWNWDLGLKG